MIPKTNYSTLKPLVGKYSAVYNEKRKHGRRVKFFNIDSKNFDKVTFISRRSYKSKNFDSICVFVYNA